MVTGGSGFIGSHLVDLLIGKGYTVVNLDILSYCASRKSNEGVEALPNYHFVHGDICDTYLVKFLLETYRIDTVIHMAAQSHVDNSFGNSIQFTKHNVLGSHALLEACRVYGKLQRFIHVSTDEVYGTTTEEGSAWREASVLTPTNPYAATKAAAEMLIHAYRNSFGLPVIITRGNNVYGPRQFPEKLIPKFIHLLRHHKKCPLHGKGASRRHFVYATDVARAFHLILTKGSVGETYNIGCHDEIDVATVAKTLKDLICPVEVDYFVEVADRSFNDFRYPVETEKLEALGWTQKVSWEDGLTQTIDWYVSQDLESYWPGVNLDVVTEAHPKFLS